jgi:DNA-binding GntR family transcriptional regulator
VTETLPRRDESQEVDDERETGLVEPVSLPPKLRQATRLRLVDDVVHVLEDAILSGRMRQGDRLLEIWISNELEVSRTTVREALLMLERRGLVSSQPRRGTFVTRISRRESEDLLATRALLESYALNSCFAALDDAVFAQLNVLLDQMRTCALPDDVPRLVQIDIAFHSLLIAGADTPKVCELWAGLNGKMSVLFLTALEKRHASIEDVVAFHQELLDGLRTGDLNQAQEAIVAHYLGNSDFKNSETYGDRIPTLVRTVAANKPDHPDVDLGLP